MDTFEKMSKTFFIADTHFNDSDIIRYCNRPFKNVEEQTKRIIENWNRVVDFEDEVWVLGDFFLSVIPCECSNTQYNMYPYAEYNSKKCMRELAEKNIEVDRAEIRLHAILIQKQDTYESTIYWRDCEGYDLPF